MGNSMSSGGGGVKVTRGKKYPFSIRHSDNAHLINFFSELSVENVVDIIDSLEGISKIASVTFIINNVECKNKPRLPQFIIASIKKTQTPRKDSIPTTREDKVLIPEPTQPPKPTQPTSEDEKNITLKPTQPTPEDEKSTTLKPTESTQDTTSVIESSSKKQSESSTSAGGNIVKIETSTAEPTPQPKTNKYNVVNNPEYFTIISNMYSTNTNSDHIVLLRENLPQIDILIGDDNTIKQFNSYYDATIPLDFSELSTPEQSINLVKKNSSIIENMNTEHSFTLSLQIDRYSIILDSNYKYIIYRQLTQLSTDMSHIMTVYSNTTLAGVYRWNDERIKQCLDKFLKTADPTRVKLLSGILIIGGYDTDNTSFTFNSRTFEVSNRNNKDFTYSDLEGFLPKELKFGYKFPSSVNILKNGRTNITDDKITIVFENSYANPKYGDSFYFHAATLQNTEVGIIGVLLNSKVEINMKYIIYMKGLESVSVEKLPEKIYFIKENGKNIGITNIANIETVASISEKGYLTLGYNKNSSFLTEYDICVQGQDPVNVYALRDNVKSFTNALVTSHTTALRKPAYYIPDATLTLPSTYKEDKFMAIFANNVTTPLIWNMARLLVQKYHTTNWIIICTKREKTNLIEFKDYKIQEENNIVYLYPTNTKLMISIQNSMVVVKNESNSTLAQFLNTVNDKIDDNSGLIRLRYNFDKKLIKDSKIQWNRTKRSNIFYNYKQNPFNVNLVANENFLGGFQNTLMVYTNLQRKEEISIPLNYLKRSDLIVFDILFKLDRDEFEFYDSQITHWFQLQENDMLNYAIILQIESNVITQNIDKKFALLLESTNSPYKLVLYKNFNLDTIKIEYKNNMFNLSENNEKFETLYLEPPKDKQKIQNEIILPALFNTVAEDKIHPITFPYEFKILFRSRPLIDYDERSLNFSVSKERQPLYDGVINGFESNETNMLTVSYISDDTIVVVSLLNNLLKESKFQTSSPVFLLIKFTELQYSKLYWQNFREEFQKVLANNNSSFKVTDHKAFPFLVAISNQTVDKVSSGFKINELVFNLTEDREEFERQKSKNNLVLDVVIDDLYIPTNVKFDNNRLDFVIKPNGNRTYQSFVYQLRERTYLSVNSKDAEFWTCCLTFCYIDNVNIKEVTLLHSQLKVLNSNILKRLFIIMKTNQDNQIKSWTNSYIAILTGGNDNSISFIRMDDNRLKVNITDELYSDSFMKFAIHKEREVNEKDLEGMDFLIFDSNNPTLGKEYRNGIRVLLNSRTDIQENYYNLTGVSETEAPALYTFMKESPKFILFLRPTESKFRYLKDIQAKCVVLVTISHIKDKPLIEFSEIVNFVVQTKTENIACIIVHLTNPTKLAFHDASSTNYNLNVLNYKLNTQDILYLQNNTIFVYPKLVLQQNIGVYTIDDKWVYNVENKNLNHSHAISGPFKNVFEFNETKQIGSQVITYLNMKMTIKVVGLS